MKKRSLFIVFIFIFMLGLAMTAKHSILPGSFNSDGATYYLMTQSLAEDFDLRWSVEDYTRVCKDWEGGPDGVILMTPDDGKSVFYGKPYVSSLFVVPFYLIFKTDGYLFFNALMLLLMCMMAYLFLASKGDETLAAAFGFTFFFGSAGFVYITWIHPEVFNMATTMAAYFLWFYTPPPLVQEKTDRRPRFFWKTADALRLGARRFLGSDRKAYVAAFLLALATFMKPPSGIMVLPFLLYYVVRRRIVRLVAFGLIYGLTLLVCSLGEYAGTGSLSAYYANRRAFYIGKKGFPFVDGTDQSAFWTRQESLALAEQKIEPEEEGGGRGLLDRFRSRFGLTKGWGQWGAIPLSFQPVVFLYDLIYFFVGRHTGFIWYFFPGFLGLIYFFSAREDLRRWLLLLGIAGSIVFYFLLLPGNYQGGGGFVGNRYLVCIYPVFVFLFPALPKLRWVVVSWIVAGLFLSQIFFTPFGPYTAYPSNQTHTRNWIFRFLPFESTLHSIPQTPYRRWGEPVIRFVDFHCSLNEDDSFLVEGEKKAEVLLYNPGRLQDVYFSIVTYNSPNNIRISDWLGSSVLRLRNDDLKPGESVGGILKFHPSFPYRIHPCFLGPYSKTFWTYDLTIETSSGYIPKLVFPGVEERTYWGCKVAFLGGGDCLQDAFYRIRLLDARVPKELVAGEDAEAVIMVRNESPFRWLNAGPSRVRLSYHWLGPQGETVVSDGLRSDFDHVIPPQHHATGVMTIRPPEKPGQYTLQIDPIVENVSWFAAKRGGPLFEAPVTVTAGGNPASQ